MHYKSFREALNHFGGAVIRTPIILWVGVLLFVVASGLLLIPEEPRILRSVQVELPYLKSLARFFAETGEFHVFNGTITVALLFAAHRRKDARLRKLAFTFFITAGIAGLAVQVIKPLVGRPRPSRCDREGVCYLTHGPTGKKGYNSYPSGHTTTAAAGSAVIAIAFPRFLVPCVLMVVGMAWSRMYLNCHFPVDTLHGTVLGVLCAYLGTRWWFHAPVEPDTRGFGVSGHE